MCFPSLPQTEFSEKYALRGFFCIVLFVFVCMFSENKLKVYILSVNGSDWKFMESRMLASQYAYFVYNYLHSLQIV